MMLFLFINLIFSLNIINAYLDYYATNMIYIIWFLSTNYYYRQPGFNQRIFETCKTCLWDMGLAGVCSVPFWCRA